ncbi:S9 family peptidase [Cryobacterium sp. Y82]|uniref:S9 family peptidase n=1 Tax=Cryobacterium sp. Y82 TaxID=2045017 RepID=UPI000CE51C74|nr:S9 family peptidase [Cryobacterium sp. Y82]
MKAADLPLLRTVSRPTIHPDGSRAVFSRVNADFAADDYVGQLWTVALVGEPAPRRITRGFRDTEPRFSPDGSLIAFLRADAGGTAQLHVVDAAGGEPLAMTDAALGVTDFRWHPNGGRIAFLARVPERGRYGTVVGLSADAEPARRIDTLRYRSNGVGYTNDRRVHVFLAVVPNVWGAPMPALAPVLADATRAESGVQPGTGWNPVFPVQASLPSGLPVARQVTEGNFDHSGLAFASAGSRLLTISARHADRDNDLRSEVIELNLSLDEDASKTHELPAPARTVVRSTKNLSISALACADDGALWLLATDVGATGRDFVGRVSALYRSVYPGDASTPIRVTHPHQTGQDLLDLEATGGISVLADGSVLVLRGSRGRVDLLRVSHDGRVEPLDCGASVASSADASGESVVVAVQSGGTSGDLVLVHTNLPGTQTPCLEPKRLTDFSGHLRATGLVPGIELTITGRDGYPVHGWVHTPPGPGPHPVLLTIHGGPYSQYTGALLDETQVYVDAGYAVVLCNPRGSSGYGEAHGRAIRQRMGTLDLADVLDFLDGALAAEPVLDAERVGIMGGSYGGYLTAWTIAHDHRFAAAIVERGFLDPDAFVGTSDIGDFFGDEYAGTDANLVRSQSPQFLVSQVQTPTLVLHSAQDLRCPLSQGERYYAALKRSGIQAELVIFPGENHELSRTGRPRHRLQRFEIILDWWARFLPSAANHRRSDEHDNENGHPVT